LCERERALEWSVCAQIRNLPAVGAQEDRKHQQPEIVTLAGRAGEHGDPANRSAGVGQQLVEAGPNRFARAVLLGDADASLFPRFPELVEQRRDDGGQRVLDAVERERLVEQLGELASVAALDCMEDLRPRLGRRAPGRLRRLAE